MPRKLIKTPYAKHMGETAHSTIIGAPSLSNDRQMLKKYESAPRTSTHQHISGNGAIESPPAGFRTPVNGCGQKERILSHFAKYHVNKAVSENPMLAKTAKAISAVKSLPSAVSNYAKETVNDVKENAAYLSESRKDNQEAVEELAKQIQNAKTLIKNLINSYRKKGFEIPTMGSGLINKLGSFLDEKQHSYYGNKMAAMNTELRMLNDYIALLTKDLREKMSGETGSGLKEDRPAEWTGFGPHPVYGRTFQAPMKGRLVPLSFKGEM